jgi:hypothetical protein
MTNYLVLAVLCAAIWVLVFRLVKYTIYGMGLALGANPIIRKPFLYVLIITDLVATVSLYTQAAGLLSKM